MPRLRRQRLSFIPCARRAPIGDKQNPATGRPWRGFGARYAEGGAPLPSHDTQLSRPPHSCDLHHMASAMAELVSYFSIRTAYAVVRRSSETLSPAHAGPFLRRSTSCVERTISPVRVRQLAE